ncbi:MAG: glycosyltransferase family 4 protein [Flavobacterium sp.]
MKILYLGNQLSKHGKSPTSIETLGVFLKQEGYTMYYASDQKKMWLRLLDMVFSVLKYRKQLDFILIDTYSTAAFWYAFIGSQLARILNVNYIPILHGGDLPARLSKYPRLCQLIFKNAYLNVAPSNYLKHHFQLQGFENVEVIPNSIELAKYQYQKREFLKPNLLWVRSFAKIYNPQMAVTVLFELQKKYPNATLTMVGPEKDGSLAETQKYARNKGVNVNFTGKLSLIEWTNLAKGCDIFINTTHFDNTPVSVIEAMALGLPVVSTNVGGIPFLLKNEENAILINDNQVDEMVNGIEKLLTEKEFSIQLQENAYQLVQAYNWKSVFLKWKNILK